MNIFFEIWKHIVSETEKSKREIEKYVKSFCKKFGADEKEIMGSEFTVITPDTKNPYKQMYVAN